MSHAEKKMDPEEKIDPEKKMDPEIAKLMAETARLSDNLKNIGETKWYEVVVIVAAVIALFTITERFT